MRGLFRGEFSVKENIMSDMWRSILTFLGLILFLVVLGVVFFAGH